MKILMIGGTGTISSAITRQLAASGHELWLINRGNRSKELPDGVKLVTGDINEHTDEVVGKLGDETFDAVCEFIGFLPEQVARDIRIFAGRTKQYVFISSASAYNKPVRQYVITEGTSLANPHWEYSRNKIACEELLMKAYRENGFPVTIVRPSHTYCERGIPVSIHSQKGSWPVLKRMIEGKQVIVHGDGSSLWTLTWNEDFARGFIGLLGNPQAIGEVFQIMSDESLTWNQIYQTIADALGVAFKPYYVASDYLASIAPAAYDLEGNLLGDKAATVVFDCSKLKRAVPGFCATTPFHEGIRRAIAYLKGHPETQTEDEEFDAWCDRVITTLEKAKNNFNTEKDIYLAGGCFWGTEHYFKQMKGVVKTEVGFANGHTENPIYKEVYTDTTGYAETVHVKYNPEVISLEFLLQMFFKAIDPTSLNKQGHDEGTRYRTGIYYTNNKDLTIIEKVFAEEQGNYQQPLVVEKLPLKNFYKAEEYHQDYLDKNPTGYCHLPQALFEFARNATGQGDK